jgi:hypothetical protein
MGYDLYWNEEPPPVAAQREKAFPENGVGNYDPVEVELYTSMRQEWGSYFRANIFSMGALRDELEAQGAIVWVEVDPATLEPKADSGLDGLPGYKLSSNDGWLLTPREIDAALAKVSESPRTWPADFDGRFPAYWGEFLTFLRNAREHGGAVVW